MKRTPFIINYFTRIFSPRRMMAGKQQFKWWQLLVTLFFLVACLMVPLTLQLTKMTTFNLSLIMPEPYELSLTNSLQSVANGSFSQQQLQAKTITSESNKGMSAVATAHPFVLADNVTTAVIFERTAVTIKSPAGLSFSLPYDDTTTTADFKSEESFKTWVNKHWFEANAGLLLPTLILVAFCALLLTQLATWLAVAVCFALVKRSHVSDITTGREVMTLSTLVMGAPAVVTAIISLFVFDVMLFMSLLSIGLIAMVLLLFYVTHFRLKKN
ncbi:hypothetical protein ACJYYY_02445 [Brochothrix campestris]|uniref:hypothetical protein n=1 Tax=Brochothrix campestris TaxID=2757 RepID=UPI0038D00939